MRRQNPNSYTSLYTGYELFERRLKKVPIEEVPVAKATLAEYTAFMPVYEKEYKELINSKQTQLKASESTLAARNDLGLYVKHFFYTLNNTIIRGEFSPSDRGYYGLDHHDDKLPYIGSFRELIKWAERIIDGEKSRVSKGGKPLDFPSLTQIQEKYDNYMNSRDRHIDTQDKYDRELEDVEAIFDKGVELLVDIWDQIEFAHRRESASSRRNKAAKWGVRYISDNEEPAPGAENYENIPE